MLMKYNRSTNQGKRNSLILWASLTKNLCLAEKIKHDQTGKVRSWEGEL
jgi:hypothetical protein